MNPETDDNFSPVLLSKSELRWLLGDIKVSKSFEYKIKSSIKRKIQTLTELEIPLLVKNNFFSDNRYYDTDNASVGRDLGSGPLSYPSKNSAYMTKPKQPWTYFLIYGRF
jgi:hypothetical protein